MRITSTVGTQMRGARQRLPGHPLGIIRATARELGGFAFGVALSVGICAAIFALARTRYLPSAGILWNITGSTQTIALNASAQDLAARAGVPLVALVLGAALNSLFVVLLASVVAVASGVPAGFWLAVHAPRRVSEALRAVTALSVALPAFFVAFLLQVAAVELGNSVGRPLLPTSGFGLDTHLVIPVLALAVAPAAYIMRLVALNATDLKTRDFVRAARAKGLSESSVIYGHIVPNMVGALGEAILSGLRLVLAGLVVVEYLVSWPGVGYLVLRAVRVQDGAVLLSTTAVLASLLLLLDRGIDLATRRTGLVTE